MKSNIRTVAFLAVVLLALLLLIAMGEAIMPICWRLVFTNVILASSLRLSLMCGSAEYWAFGVYVGRGLHLGVTGQEPWRAV